MNDNDVITELQAGIESLKKQRRALYQQCDKLVNRCADIGGERDIAIGEFYIAEQQRNDLLTACEAQAKADNWFGASDTGRKLKDKAKKLRVAAIKKATE